MTKTMIDTLTSPPDELQQNSLQLQTFISGKISKRGCIPFHEYMHDCLYAPHYGYYTANTPKFGKKGDFITAPEISPHYCEMIAKQAMEVFALTERHILEFGAGSGAMAGHILAAFENNNIPLEQYFILDVSPHLVAQQKETISLLAPNMLSKVIWLTELPNAFSGMILANEVLDAMPVHLFTMQDNQLLEQEVILNADNHYALSARKPLPGKALTYLNFYKKHFSNGYQSEINLAAAGWIEKLAECIEKGLVLIIDYGFSGQEYYAPARYMGTLLCHYQHMVHSDYFWWPGLQDLTAHVDFTLLAIIAEQAGFNVQGYTTQADFLLALGIDKHVPKDLNAQYQFAQTLKQLLLPSEMGELFKVFALTKNIQINLTGFSGKDLLGRL